jgi:hypothetical protein
MPVRWFDRQTADRPKMTRRTNFYNVERLRMGAPLSESPE